jgi:hypothetical protein
MGVAEATRPAPATDKSTAVRSLVTRAWVESAGVTTATRAAFLLVALAASWFLSTETQGAPQQSFLSLWDNWDAHHLVTIGEHGYFSAASDAHATAFFPLFPLLAAALLVVVANPVAAGLVVSALASVVAGAYLFRLAEEEAGEGAGRRALLYLMLFPTAVFLVAPYSEAVFLAGAIAAFYYARRQRWHLVGIPAAVAMGARFAGVFVLLGLAVEFLRQRDLSAARVTRAALALVIGAAPLVAYCIYLAQTTGDPLHFVDAQRAGWGRDLVGPIESFRATFDTWGRDYPTNWLLAWRGEIVAAAAGLGMVAWALAKREWGYATFMGSMMAVLLSSSWYYSIPRMLLSFFPVMVFLAQWSRGSDTRHETILLVTVPIATMGAILFTQGIWFY